MQTSGTQAAQAAQATAVPRGVVNVAEAGGGLGGQAGRQVDSNAVPRAVTSEEPEASGAVAAAPRIIPAPGGIADGVPRSSGAVPRAPPGGAGAAATAAPRFVG